MPPLVLDGSGGVSGVDGTASNPAIEGTDSNTGIFYPAADTVAIGTGGTEALRVNSSQNVGIGTSSPQKKFVVSDAGATGMEWSPTDYAGNMRQLAYNRSTSAYVALRTEASQHEWYVGGTERARITSGGALLVGATALPSGVPFTKFYVEQSVADYSASFYSTSSTAVNNYGLAVLYSNAAPNNASNEFFIGRDSAAIRFRAFANGGLANYSANNVNLSDRREKTNFAPAKNYLDAICAIPVQTFNYIDQNMEDDPGETLGVVAQDVEAVAPELVMESNWGTEEEPKMRLSIYQTDLQYALMKCIQELNAKVEALEAQLKGNA